MVLLSFNVCFGGLYLQVVFVLNYVEKCFLCGQIGYLVVECEGKFKRKRGEYDEKGGELDIGF